MAKARVSIGKISLTVRYAALAPEPAKKKHTMSTARNVQTPPNWLTKIPASTTATAAEPRYVSEIIGFRPTVSKSGPRSTGPAKLDSAHRMKNTGTMPEATE